jgi:hypothetical protein
MGLLDDEDITPLVVVSVPFLGGLLGLGMVSALLARVRAATVNTLTPSNRAISNNHNKPNIPQALIS